jgi:hypothetical protein
VCTAPGSVLGKLPSKCKGFPQIPPATCNVSLAVFQPIRQRCQAWPVTYALVSNVTMHGLSLTQPCMTRLWLVLSIMTVNVWRGRP